MATGGHTIHDVARAALLDAAIGYDFAASGLKWNVALNTKNLTDEYYLANQARGLPRRFVLSVTATF